MDNQAFERSVQIGTILGIAEKEMRRVGNFYNMIMQSPYPAPHMLGALILKEFPEMPPVEQDSFRITIIQSIEEIQKAELHVVRVNNRINN